MLYIVLYFYIFFSSVISVSHPKDTEREIFKKELLNFHFIETVTISGSILKIITSYLHSTYQY